MQDNFLSSIYGNASMLPLNKEYDDITKSFRESMGSENICVSAIYKIENPLLECRFNERAASITAARNSKPEVVNVFHGTTLKAAANIVNTGFDPTYSTIAAYGKGTYASPSARTAVIYCKDVKQQSDFSMIFRCRFLKGKHGFASSSNKIDTDVIDYCGRGDILVTPYADGIIPDYLICYYQWDK
jgi:Poly(ADP-ribose) polymerase catalytic domain